MVITKIGQRYSFFLTLATVTLDVSNKKNQGHPHSLEEIALILYLPTQKRQGKLIMKKIFIYLTAASVNNTLTPTFSEDCMAGRFSAVNIYVTNGGP